MSSMPLTKLNLNTTGVIKEINCKKSVKRRLLDLGLIPNIIASLGQTLKHLKHLIQISLSTDFSFEFIHPEGQFFSHIPQEIHFSVI